MRLETSSNRVANENQNGLVVYCAAVNLVAYLASVFGDIDIGFKGTHVNRANKALKNIPAVE